jgi:outer membrane lipase/esterase
VGGAIGYADNETVFDRNRGSMDVDGYTLSVYSTYYHDENSYLDAIGSVGWSDFTNRRAFDSGTASIPEVEVKGDTKGQKYALSIGGGYDFYHKGLSFGPAARLNYINAGIDSYAESSSTGFEFDYDSQDVESLTSMLGGQLSYAISTSNGIFTPQLLFEWAHEYKDNSRFITARFLYDPSSTPLPFNLQTDDPDRDYFNLGVGLSATFAAGKSAFIYYETELQREEINLDTISAGFRLTF